MTPDWMVDLLRDMTRFAHANDMPELGGRLDEARRVAEAEVSRRRPATQDDPPSSPD